MSVLERGVSAPEEQGQSMDVTVDIAKTVRKSPRTSVADKPDRVIAATALALGLPLVTRDGKIRASGIETI